MARPLALSPTSVFMSHTDNFNLDSAYESQHMIFVFSEPALFHFAGMAIFPSSLRLENPAPTLYI